MRIVSAGFGFQERERFPAELGARSAEGPARQLRRPG